MFFYLRKRYHWERKNEIPLARVGKSAWKNYRKIYECASQTPTHLGNLNQKSIYQEYSNEYIVVRTSKKQFIHGSLSPSLHLGYEAKFTILLATLVDQCRYLH
jgi:hypothetical protein